MARRSGIRLEGTGDLSAGLSYSRKELVKEAAAALKTGAEMLRQRARDYAPFDEGDLERSVKVMDKNLSQKAAAGGSMSISIAVDGDVEKRSRPGVTVEKYASIMESGPYNLGDNSEDKNEEMSAFYARDLGGANAVGPGFFSRAIDDGEPYVMKVIEAKIKAAMARANARTSASKGKTKGRAK